MNQETAAMPVVLIVDDDAQTRLLVTETLSNAAFGSKTTTRGETAPGSSEGEPITSTSLRARSAPRSGCAMALNSAGDLVWNANQR